MNSSLTYEELNKAAATFGTPLYVYHGEKIESQYQNLLTHFSSKSTRFFYACKSLTNIHILNLVKNTGCNIDCSSINEVKLAIHVGFDVENILYTSNSVAFEEIKEAVSVDVRDVASNHKVFWCRVLCQFDAVGLVVAVVAALLFREVQ